MYLCYECIQLCENKIKIMTRIFVSIVFVIGLFLQTSANDVRIRGEAKVQALTETTALITFPLSWEHSWRDPESWDAVYLFVKYRRVGVNEPWHHAYLKNSGHRAAGGENVPAMEFLPVTTVEWNALRYDTLYFGNYGQTPMNADPVVPGVFIYRRAPGSGDIEINRVSLEWDFKMGDLSLYYDVTVDDIRQGKIEVSVQAVEMVYVPNGPYYLGDRISGYSFVSEECDAAFYMDTDDSVHVYTMGLTASTPSGWKNNWVVPKLFPTGYTGFYTMKYEVSQEQYVNFLNRLTYADQKKRIGNNLDQMVAGDFAFGAKSAPNFRNGIVLQERFATNDSAVIFGFDLNVDSPINDEDDGKSVACNYLTPEDLQAYTDWAGLRPNSEMEYEKGCRQRNPAVASNSRSFAWGTPTFESMKVWNSSTMANDNTENEQVLFPTTAPKGRMNGPKVHNLGPVKCGAFASESSDIYMSGASRWGLMEMTGNLAEIYYNALDGKDFNGEVFGDGNIWSSVASWRADSTIHLYHEPVVCCGKGYIYASKTLDLPTISKKNNPMKAVVQYRQAYDFGEYHCGWVSIDVDVTFPWPVLEWPAEKENFMLRGGSFATEAGSTGSGEIVADKMAVSYRGDTIYQKIADSETRLYYAGFRAGRSVPMKSILTGVIACENMQNRDTSVICTTHPYTISEIENGDDTPATTIYVWEMNNAGKGWETMANSNTQNLTITECLVDTVLRHEYKFRRQSIASHAQSYGNEVTVIVPGYKINGGQGSLQIGSFDSSIELTTLLGAVGDVKVDWRFNASDAWTNLDNQTGVTDSKVYLNRSDFVSKIPMNDGGVCRIQVTVTIDGCVFTKELELVIKTAASACPPSVADADGRTYPVVQIGGMCLMKEDLKVSVDGVSTGGLYTWAQIEAKGGALCPEGFHIVTQQEWDYLWIQSAVYGENATCEVGKVDYISSSDPFGCMWGWGLFDPGIDVFLNNIGFNTGYFNSTRKIYEGWWAAGPIGKYVRIDYDVNDHDYGCFSTFADDSDVQSGIFNSGGRPVRCIKK